MEWLHPSLGLMAGAAVLGLIWLRLRRRAAPVGGPRHGSGPDRPAYRPDLGASPPTGSPASRFATTPEPPAISGLRLLREGQLPPERLAELAAQLRSLTIPPVGPQQLVSTDVMAAASARALGELVMAEPRLAARVLTRANSAFYGLPSPIRSIPHAITYLGLPAVRSMALTLLLAESVPATSPAHRRYSERTWSAALLAADLCNLLGTRLGVPDTGVLGTHAILSFLGELALPALAGSEPDLDGRQGLVERHQRSQQRLGVSAVLVGTILMQEWRLPEPMIREVEAVGRLVVTPADPSDSRRAAQRGLVYACGRLGESIARGTVTHPGQLTVTADDNPALFHLQSYLALPHLARLPDLLSRPEVVVVLDRMISATRGATASA